MAKPRRLFFDIEVSPNVGVFWTAGFKQNISYDSIIKERAIICICYKWAGEKKVHSLEWTRKQDDRILLKKFIDMANTADEMIGHNGDNFDLKWIRTRCLFHGISCMPKYITIDTLKQARSKFKFNSNRLDYIAKFLGIGSKIHTTFDMWKQLVLENDAKALKDMVKYCKADVALLERVYDKMCNHIEPKVHHGVANDGHQHTCPECGGDRWRFIQYRITARGYRRKQQQCQECGKYNTIPIK